MRDPTESKRVGPSNTFSVWDIKIPGSRNEYKIPEDQVIVQMTRFCNPWLEGLTHETDNVTVKTLELLLGLEQVC